MAAAAVPSVAAPTKWPEGQQVLLARNAPAAGLRLPLTDKVIDLKAICALISNAQTREKVLKIFQYSARLTGYILARTVHQALSKHFETLGKNLSTARRFFKLCRFFKHFEDLKDAREEKSSTFSGLLYLDVVCNVVADVSEDITSLEKCGFVRKGVLPKRTEFYANWCQLVLAVVEIAVSGVKAERARSASDAAGQPLPLARKSTMASLELSKFVADLVKAFWDCELSFASELAFYLSGLYAAIISTHKYAVKVLK
eukprot:TRINITY_DN64812_c0_g1_i1.p1 TRINITY_DN64812_c0_g1~~TRINITY_DN64812_c0_g1_i1.p1  ORF type:complete len:272 (-),score=79.16 TRINITY_DN64812_c0_g1_i1:74-844(-)